MQETPELLKECPITQMPMRIPVITNSGNTYEFEAIAEHISKSGRNLDPLSREPIEYLLLNRSALDAHLTLNDDEKDRVARYYVELERCFTKIKIYQVQTLSDISSRIDALHAQSIPRRVVPIESVVERGFITSPRTHMNMISRTYAAIQANDTTLLQNALSACQHQQATCNCGCTLFVAVRTSTIEMIRLLLSHIHFVVPSEQLAGETVLSIAFNRPEVEIREMFLDYFLRLMINPSSVIQHQLGENADNLKELSKYRVQLWTRLRELGTTYRIEPRDYLNLLVEIDESKKWANRRTPHLLYLVFKNPYLQSFYKPNPVFDEIKQEIERLRSTRLAAHRLPG